MILFNSSVDLYPIVQINNFGKTASNIEIIRYIFLILIGLAFIDMFLSIVLYLVKFQSAAEYGKNLICFFIYGFIALLIFIFILLYLSILDIFQQEQDCQDNIAMMNNSLKKSDAFYAISQQIQSKLQNDFSNMQTQSNHDLLILSNNAQQLNTMSKPVDLLIFPDSIVRQNVNEAIDIYQKIKDFSNISSTIDIKSIVNLLVQNTYKSIYITNTMNVNIQNAVNILKKFLTILKSHAITQFLDSNIKTYNDNNIMKFTNNGSTLMKYQDYSNNNQQTFMFIYDKYNLCLNITTEKTPNEPITANFIVNTPDQKIHNLFTESIQISATGLIFPTYPNKGTYNISSTDISGLINQETFIDNNNISQQITCSSFFHNDLKTFKNSLIKYMEISEAKNIVILTLLNSDMFILEFQGFLLLNIMIIKRITNSTINTSFVQIKIYQNNLSALFCSNTFQLNTMNNIINTQQFTLIQSYLFKTEANDQIISINNNYQVNINYSACAISYNGIYKFMIKLSDTMTGIYLFNNNNTVNVLLFSQGQVYQKTITSNLINLNTDMNLDLLNINS